jgi:cytochrome b
VKRTTEASGARIGARAPIQVWDAPIRLFHWLIVVLIALAWWTAQNGQMQWHKRLGYAIAGLLLFRLYWGVVGISTARFSRFVKGPATVARYARGLLKRPSIAGPPGHNPMGGWSVIALLGAIGGIVGLGLFSVDVDGEESGPFADRVSFEAGRFAAHWHHLLFNGLLALIVLHLCAVAFYAVVKRDNLIGPMITGKRRAETEAETETEGAVTAPLWRLFLGAALGVAFAVMLALGFKP